MLKRGFIAVACLLSGFAQAQIAEIFQSLTTYGTLEVSSLRVIAAQFSTSAKGMINADVAMTQGGVAAKALLATTTQLLEHLQNYGVYSGQGPQICMTINQGEDIDAATKRTNLAIDSFMGQSGDARGKYAAPDYERKRSSNHLEKYCSAQEHNLGICTSQFDGMAVFGSDYSKFARTEQLTEKKAKAGQDFIAAMLPPALPQLASSQCDDACINQGYNVRALNAMASIAALPIAVQLANRTGGKTYLVGER